MKYGFSTLACPSWGFREIFTSAKDLGYSGVEIRGISDELYAPNIKRLSADKLEETRAYLENMCIDIAILSSSAELAIEDNIASSISEAKAYIDLASELNVPYVRVLCTNSAAPNGGNIELAKQSYQLLCEYGKNKSVKPLIETNGILCDSKLMKEFIESIDSNNKGILWDIHHPYRFNGESVEYTVENIGKYVEYAHVKDSLMKDGKVCYKMVGYGDVPIKEAIVNLANIGYNGYLTLEWVKRWDKTLEEPGVALCHYISYIKSL